MTHLAAGYIIEAMNEDELIALAAKHGCKISPRQLERWHKADLIPRPEVTPPEAFAQGNRSTYPDEAGLRVPAVCRLMERQRNLNALHFWLWLEEDVPISLPLLKKTIRQV